VASLIALFETSGIMTVGLCRSNEHI